MCDLRPYERTVSTGSVGQTMFKVCASCGFNYDSDSYQKCPNPHCPSHKAEFDQQLVSLFQHLWTKAVETEDYDKQEWLRLQKMLLQRGIVT